MGRPLSSLCHDRPERSEAASPFPTVAPSLWLHRSVCSCNHAFVNRFILLPKFSLAEVVVNCDTFYSASGSGSMRVRIPQPPSPPGLLGPDPGRFRCEFFFDLQTTILMPISDRRKRGRISQDIVGQEPLRHVAAHLHSINLTTSTKHPVWRPAFLSCRFAE